MLKNFPIQKRARKSPATNSLPQEESRLLELLGQEDFLPEKLDAKPLHKKFPTPQKDTGVIIRQRTPLPVLEEVEEEPLHDITEPEPEPEEEESGGDDCPCGFRFGHSCELDDKCDECEEWEPCRNKLDEIEASKKPEPDPEEEYEEPGLAPVNSVAIVTQREPAPVVFSLEYQIDHDITDKQILTVRHQLHVILTGEPPEYCSEWSEFEEGAVGELDGIEGFLDELNDLTHEWMSSQVDPRLITERFKDGRKTLWFLRKYFKGWKEYEAKHKDRQELNQLIDRAATWLALGNIDDQEEIKETLADSEYHPDKNKYIKKYIAGLEEYAAKQRQVAKKNYPSAFENKPLCAETKWITDLPIYQKKPGKRFFDLMDLLWKRKLSNRDSKALLEKINYKPGNIPTNTPKKRNPSAVIKRERSYKKESSKWALVQPDASELAKELGVSGENIRLDLKKAVNAGVLKEVGRPGPRQSTVYSIGYWSWYVDNGVKKPRARAYLIKKLKDQIVSQLATIRKSKAPAVIIRTRIRIRSREGVDRCGELAGHS